MEVYKNILDPEFARKLFKESHEKFLGSDFGWSTNYNWQPNLVKSSHPVLMRPYDNETTDKILDALIAKGAITHKNFAVMNYVWTKLSYITWHNDDNYDQSLTIYLNDFWDWDWGGLFLYKEDNTNHVKGIIPEFNSAVVNVKNYSHCVTPVHLDCQMPRITVQIFSKNGKQVKTNPPPPNTWAAKITSSNGQIDSD